MTTISTEWAKQIIFEAYGPDHDFDNMRTTLACSGINSIHLPIPKTFPLSVEWISLEAVYAPLEYETIHINKWFDPINEETTLIGYGPITNTIVLVEDGTRKAEMNLSNTITPW